MTASSSGLPGVGIFGTGARARALVPHLRSEGFAIEALWGLTQDEANITAKDLNIPYATNKIDEVLLRKEIDLIIIICPPSHHSQIAVKALGIGKHVAVQSPGGLNQDETLRMVQAAQYYPRLTATLTNVLRFVPAFTKMRSAITSGLIGTSLTLVDVRLSMGPLVGKQYSWLCDSAMGGGLLNLLGCHVIDLIHFLCGGRPARRAHGVLRTLTKTTPTINGIREINADDCTTFQLEMDGDTFATVTLNCQLGGFSQEVIVCGSEGHLVARNGDLFGRKNDEDEEQLLFTDQEGNDNDSASSNNPLFSGIYLKGLSHMFSELAQSLRSRGGAQPDDEKSKTTKNAFSMFENAQYVQAVIEAIRESSKNRCWTKVILKEHEEPKESMLTHQY